MSTLKILADASNFAKVICKANVGNTIEFPNGDKIKLLAYFVSNKDRKGNKQKGRQTAIDYKKGSEEFIDVSTEVLKQKYCTERETTPHSQKVKKFILSGLSIATAQELSEAIKAIQEEQAKRKAAKQKRIEQLRKELAEAEAEV